VGIIRPLEKIARKFGFTKTETNVILFILLAFLLGLGVNLFKDLSNNKDYLEFNYKAQDSLFDAASGDPQRPDTAINTSEKRIASKGELLDFSKAKKTNEKSVANFPDKIIDLNSASASELLTLPGLGKKSVENIIDYRNKNGRFKKVGDLLNVKGIGKTKFEKIKKLVTIN